MQDRIINSARVTILFIITTLLLSYSAEAYGRENGPYFRQANNKINLLQFYANKRVKKELRRLKRQALECTDEEGVIKNEVMAYFKNRPPTPHWKKLKKMKKDYKKFTKRASEFSRNDKVKHCVAGYLIAQELDYTTAVFSGYLKEAMDLADCNPRTHFEKADHQATVRGGRLAVRGKSIEQCRSL